MSMSAGVDARFVFSGSARSGPFSGRLEFIRRDLALGGAYWFGIAEVACGRCDLARSAAVENELTAHIATSNAREADARVLAWEPDDRQVRVRIALFGLTDFAPAQSPCLPAGNDTRSL